jgi:hypothetical protein
MVAFLKKKKKWHVLQYELPSFHHIHFLFSSYNITEAKHTNSRNEISEKSHRKDKKRQNTK